MKWNKKVLKLLKEKRKCCAFRLRNFQIFEIITLNLSVKGVISNIFPESPVFIFYCLADENS